MLKLTEYGLLLLAAGTGGLCWGPWVALTVSLRHLPPAVLLPVLARLGHYLGRVMTTLLPLTLLAHLPVLAVALGS